MKCIYINILFCCPQQNKMNNMDYDDPTGRWLSGVDDVSHLWLFPLTIKVSRPIFPISSRHVHPLDAKFLDPFFSTELHPRSGGPQTPYLETSVFDSKRSSPAGTPTSESEESVFPNKNLIKDIGVVSERLPLGAPTHGSGKDAPDHGSALPLPVEDVLQAQVSPLKYESGNSWLYIPKSYSSCIRRYDAKKLERPQVRVCQSCNRKYISHYETVKINCICLVCDSYWSKF
jgi:hypothetical protein